MKEALTRHHHGLFAREARIDDGLLRVRGEPRITTGFEKGAALKARRYNFVLPAAFAAFHRSLAAAEILALPAADIVRFPFATGFFPFALAQRAF